MTNPIEDFDKAKVILITGSNTTENHPIIANRIRRAIDQGTKVILFDPREIPLARKATIWCRQRPGTDVAWINCMMHVILSEGLADKEFIQNRCEDFEALSALVEDYDPKRVSEATGIPAEDLIAAARLYASEKPASIAYAMGITQHITGTDNVKSLANLAMLCGNMGIAGGGLNPLRGQNNVQGACDMGALPNVYPGYQKVDDDAARQKFELAWGVKLSKEPGLTMTEILKAAEVGKVKALYIMGENPMLSDPDIIHVESALKNTEFLVVQDLFLTETAQYADVVLPATSYLERDGTVTNTERRIQRLNKVIEPVGQSRADWEIIVDLANRLGYEMSYENESQIMDEIAELTPQYGGISYQRLDQGEELCWPCPNKTHPGTPILHVGKFSRGLGKFHAIEYKMAAELPDPEYPLILTTGRVAFQFHTGTMTRKAPGLEALDSGPFVEVNPQDAKKLGVKEGQLVNLSSRRGQIKLPTKFEDGLEEGVVFVPFHYVEAAANLLTNSALDPIAKIPEFKVCAVRMEKA
jgi:formate dehydrogenase alpha subunit